MAGNPNFNSDALAYAIEAVSKDVADAVTKNNALLTLLSKRGKVKTFTGGPYITETVRLFENGNVGSYSGYEILPIAAQDSGTRAEWGIKQYAAPVSVSGLELLQVSGEQAIANLLDEKLEAAESTLKSMMSADIYGDGTGNGGKAITGLRAAVPLNPTNVYGGIDRSIAANARWKNKTFDISTDGSGAMTAANVQQYMNATFNKTVVGARKPNLIVADNSFYALYESSLQAQQRFVDASIAVGGFSTLAFKGNVPVVLDGGDGGQAPTGFMWFLNTDFIALRPHVDKNFVPSEKRSSVNQDAETQMILWAGNLTCCNPAAQAVLSD